MAVGVVNCVALNVQEHLHEDEADGADEGDGRGTRHTKQCGITFHGNLRRNV